MSLGQSLGVLAQLIIRLGLRLELKRSDTGAARRAGGRSRPHFVEMGAWTSRADEGGDGPRRSARAGPPHDELYIKTLTGRTVTVPVWTDMGIVEVKEELERTLDIPVAHQRLIMSGKELVDSATIANYNIRRGHTIHLVLRLPGPAADADTDAAPAASASSNSASSGAA